MSTKFPGAAAAAATAAPSSRTRQADSAMTNGARREATGSRKFSRRRRQGRHRGSRAAGSEGSKHSLSKQRQEQQQQLRQRRRRTGTDARSASCTCRQRARTVRRWPEPEPAGGEGNPAEHSQPIGQTPDRQTRGKVRESRGKQSDLKVKERARAWAATWLCAKRGGQKGVYRTPECGRR